MELITQTPAEMRQKNIDEHGYPFKFSIVMAVYMVEDYLHKAIESLLNQTIGFEENVQLILIDDGSPDNSGAICDEYYEQYPDNIIVIHKENGGVSSARNAGLEKATGKYVNFLDSDDNLSLSVLKKVYDFFAQNGDYVDVVSIPVIFIGAKKDKRKSKKRTRVIDLRREPTAIQMSVASAFIKSAVAKALFFDENLATAEDAKFLAEALLDKQQLGVVSNCTYNYRVREGENLSATQSSNKKDWYSASLKNYSLAIYSLYKAQLGYIPWFVQMSVMYDLIRKIKLPEFPENLLNEEEQAEFFRLVREILLQTEDKIIEEQQNFTSEYKYFLLKLKYGHDTDLIKRHNSLLYTFGNTILHDLKNGYTVLSFAAIEEQYLQIEGIIGYIYSSEKLDVVLTINDNPISDLQLTPMAAAMALGEKLTERVAFSAKIPITEDVDKYIVNIHCRTQDDMLVRRNRLQFGKFMPIGSTFPNSYYYKNGWLMRRGNGGIVISKCTKLQAVSSELKFLVSTFKSKRKFAKKAVVLRCIRHIAKPFIRKDIWLLSDRAYKADDNAEVLFHYISRNKPDNVAVYFAIGKNAADYNRLKKYGKVIPLGGGLYKFFCLLGATSISSQASEQNSMPFPWGYDYFRDLTTDYRFVFLQHGVIHTDISGWLNRFNKNIELFVATTQAEYTDLTEGSYHYTDKQIKLTGLPRHDLLYKNDKKHITIMPTWRIFLTQLKFTANLPWRKPISNFTSTQYYAFYNSLINSEILLAECKRLGYTLCFAPHPDMKTAIDLFEKSEDVHFINADTPYRDVFAESSLVVTDYSSIAFDVAYMYNPLIYCQFDSEEFFKAHHCKEGYFDYERDGFGEVEYTLEDTISRIIEYMQNGCQLKDKYRKRIENTFAFNDKDNCKRVVNAILNLT
ncbi:MAG: bifunctional glycosyltransferase family 2 protein/CDP-glycerol:glycerophosphate glycerophosphotransferase [Defluviitaleaceae bacterium]|nr:bifunctional glycosyltransferase family 2 protein/CDP-glycerol:glycerophosphate glycerophosphotransferase [Defluviitaleaceae bacterium]